MAEAALLSDVIQIRYARLRAIRLEDDLPDGDLLNGYTLTAQAVVALQRIAEGLTNHARAWTLTGPYGSGKSFFGLFLSHLFDPQRSGHKTAWQAVNQTDPFLAQQLRQVLKATGGLRTVAVTGARASLQKCLVRGFDQALRAGDFPPYLRRGLERAGRAGSRAFLDWIKTFTETVSSVCPRVNGALIIFDEMGKALEQAAAHPQDSDVYLLQELAELAARSREHPLVFIGILHQSFEGYAASLDRTTQREWTKVQGRFEDIPFQEPAVQQMRLLADVFMPPRCALPKLNFDLKAWRPATMDADEFERLSCKTYPLHPSVLAALPHIFRRLGQNERSIFSYLSSQEPFGFQAFLAAHRLGETLRLPDVFDYLAANYRNRIYGADRMRVLTETLERLESAPNLKPIEQALVKTIGLLNWLGETTQMQAEESRIFSALTPDYTRGDLRAALTALQRRSMIVYRRFNRTYSVWQGSDIDLEERMETARAAVDKTLSLAETLQRYLPPRPLLAGRHSYLTGAQRFFEVRYVDSHNRLSVPLTASPGASGVVLFCLPGASHEISDFSQWALGEQLRGRSDLVVGVAKRAIRLKELVQELSSLYWVREHTPALRDDPVARREWRARVAVVERAVRAELHQSLNLQQISALQACQWFYQGEDVSSKTRRGLSALLSDICDALYAVSPRLRNELLNRRELTSQGAAARRTLVEGILTRAEQPLLGIQKFPPERSMYETLLRRGGLHRQQGEEWKIVPPPQEDPLNLQPTWEAIAQFVFGSQPEPRPLTDLYARLCAPPYGVTAGLAPVLLVAFYKVHEQEITLYKEGSLLVEPTIADWEVLLRRPELFALAGCRLSGMRAAIVERMARGLGVSPYVIPVVRSLIGRLKSLPEHAWRTRNLPEVSLQVRRVVETTRSPERFLFVELPEAVGLLPFEAEALDLARFDEFFARLNQALEALGRATPDLLARARDTWLLACGLPTGEEGWQIFRAEAQHLVARVSHPKLLPLLKRAAEAADSRSALESVLAFIADRPLRAWSDADVEQFEARARHLAEAWRAERDEWAFPALSPELQTRAEALANRLEAVLRHSDEPPEMLRAAVCILRERLKS